MENYSADEINDANRRIAAYNMAQQQFEEDDLVLFFYSLLISNAGTFEIKIIFIQSKIIKF